MFNMSQIFYSKSLNGFFCPEINKIMPDDVIEITTEAHSELLKKQSEGLVIQSDENGYPVALKPELTDDEIKANNESVKNQLINETNNKISLLQDAIDLDIAEDGDEDSLKAWKKYRVLLSRVDTSPSNIEWPIKP